MKKKLFDASGSGHGRVIINYAGSPEGELTLVAEAFHQMAKEALAGHHANPHFGQDHFDYLAYPIVFLYRHALELYMKAAVLEGASMLEIQGVTPIRKDRLLKTHNLEVLRKDLERVFAAFGWDWDLGLPHMRKVEDFRALISEFDAADRGSYTFRYPMDTAGKRALKPVFRFNLFNFGELLDELFPVLEGAATNAYETLLEVSEERAEAQRLALEESPGDEA